MAEQIIEKLKRLDEQVVLLLARRAKESNQNLACKKTLVTPLTFDFDTEYEETITTSKPKTVSRVTKEKPNVIKRQKRTLSSRTKPESRKNNFETLSLRTRLVASNIKKPERNPEAQPKKITGETPDLNDDSEDSLNERSTLLPQMIDLSTKENESIPNDQICRCTAREKTPLTLSMENELQKLNCKIISVGSAKSESIVEQHASKPIIYHDIEFVKELILTQNGQFSQPLGSRNIYPCKRVNVALGRHHEISEPFVKDQSVTPISKKTRPTTWKNDRDRESLDMSSMTIVDKQSQALSDETPEKVFQEKMHNFSQSLFDLNKKYVGSHYQTILLATSAKTGKFERMFSAEKLVRMHKFSAPPTPYYSNPIKRTLQVHFVSTITPLDDLLTSSCPFPCGYSKVSQLAQIHDCTLPTSPENRVKAKPVTAESSVCYKGDCELEGGGRIPNPGVSAKELSIFFEGGSYLENTAAQSSTRPAPRNPEPSPPPGPQTPSNTPRHPSSALPLPSLGCTMAGQSLPRVGIAAFGRGRAAT
ncbi:uncharacterized protein C1orf141 homolog [Suncus etruscus]|uniref:uncharacterized protein C1orf141 homolog n=1 Tax=Suncus etruscus TaxID=109475 RepID=UPI00210FFFCA|nr:uncharacterized protein C1orf141 homolog [Suncus etruscus]